MLWLTNESRSTPLMASWQTLAVQFNMNTMDSIIQEVHTEATRIPGLRQYLPKHANQRRFLIDLTIVALSIRTGYLVDLFTPNDPVKWFSSLLAALRIVSITNILPCSDI